MDPMGENLLLPVASCSNFTLRENTLFINDPAWDSSQASRFQGELIYIYIHPSWDATRRWDKIQDSESYPSSSSEVLLAEAGFCGFFQRNMEPSTKANDMSIASMKALWNAPLQGVNTRRDDVCVTVKGGAAKFERYIPLYTWPLRCR